MDFGCCVNLIDSEVAALMLQVTPRRVQQLVKDGELQNHGTPRRILLLLDEVESFRLRFA